MYWELIRWDRVDFVRVDLVGLSLPPPRVLPLCLYSGLIMQCFTPTSTTPSYVYDDFYRSTMHVYIATLYVTFFSGMDPWNLAVLHTKDCNWE